MSKTKKFFNLAIPAPRRLAMMKAAVVTPGKTWRDVRATTHAKVAAYCGTLSQGGKEWYALDDDEYFRDERPANHVEYSGVRHSGWFTDSDGFAKAWGIVARLPHGKFITGYLWDSNGERVYFPYTYDDEIEAAQAADREAELFAEKQIEDSNKWQAARGIEQDIDDAMNRLRECLALRNNPCFKRLREEATYLIEQIRNQREELATEYADFLL